MSENVEKISELLHENQIIHQLSHIIGIQTVDKIQMEVLADFQEANFFSVHESWKRKSDHCTFKMSIIKQVVAKFK